MCNLDANCKGYVEEPRKKNQEFICQIGTTSPCPNGCDSLLDVGNVGESYIKATCGLGYGRCFIKHSRS